jgi:hypothetical protein
MPPVILAEGDADKAQISIMETLNGIIERIALNEYIAEDQKTIQAFLDKHYDNVNSKWFQKSPLEQINLLKNYLVDFQTLFDTKETLGYEYNPIMKREIAIPVRIGIYNNFLKSAADTPLYLSVGDAGIGCVVPLSLEEKTNSITKLTRSLEKVREWTMKCRSEKMDAEKDLELFQAADLKFFSMNGGKTCFLRVSVKDQIITKTIRLNILNVNCLLRDCYSIGGKLKKKMDDAKNSELLK